MNIGKALERFDDEQYLVALQAIDIRRGTLSIGILNKLTNL
ncbi:hypothetical protein [Paenibacillus agricola]|nr:hypothetical protein [Paenibacillus agricola]